MVWSCEECNGDLVPDSYGVMVCSKCGLVQKYYIVKNEAFASSRQRLGSLISRKSATFVDFSDHALSNQQQMKFYRLKKLQESVYNGSGLDLFRLHKDLEFISKHLMLPDVALEMVVNCFDEILAKIRNPYNSYGLLMAICVVTVSRHIGEKAPVRLSEVIEAFGMRGYRISMRVMAKNLSFASNIVPLPRKFRMSEDFVVKVISKLKDQPYISLRLSRAGLDYDNYFSKLEELSKDILSRVPPPRRSGKNPFLLASSAVYESSAIMANEYGVPNIFTKAQFSRDIGIAEFTLRNHLSTIFNIKKPAFQASITAACD